MDLISREKSIVLGLHWVDNKIAGNSKEFMPDNTVD